MGKGKTAPALGNWGMVFPLAQKWLGASSQRVVECSPDVGNAWQVVVEFKPKKGGLWKWETVILLQAVN